jgi:hypothetical protein
MSFKYDYIPVDKLEESPKLETILLTEGEARFKVMKAYDRERDGTPMVNGEGLPQFKLMLAVTDKTGRKGLVWHNISARMQWAIKQLADSVGMPALYSPHGQVDVFKFEGQDGVCMIATQPAENQYPARSVVKRYLPHPGLVAKNNPSNDDDNVPF